MAKCLYKQNLVAALLLVILLNFVDLCLSGRWFGGTLWSVKSFLYGKSTFITQYCSSVPL